MRQHVVMTLAAALLLAGVFVPSAATAAVSGAGFAAPAGHAAMRVEQRTARHDSRKGAATPSRPAIPRPFTYNDLAQRPHDVLPLGGHDRVLAWRDLHWQMRDQSGPPGFSPIVGWQLPRDLAVKVVTPAAARAVPALAPYVFTMAQGRLLIVNPLDMTVAAVIRGVSPWYVARM
jgi:hypothetical protein